LLVELSHLNKKQSRWGHLKSIFTGGNSGGLLSFPTKFMPQYGEPPRRSTSDWTKLYNKSPRMNPIHQVASDVATSVYGVYEQGASQKIKISNNPVALLLKTPNPNVVMTEYVLMYITQVYLMLPSGEAFWIKERNGLGKVKELWPVPPSWVLEIPSVSKSYFTIYPSGNASVEPTYVPMCDMVYFKKPDVANPYLRGIGRAEGVGDEIETDEYMAKYQKRYFFNDAIPPMVGMMPGAGEDEVNRNEERWQQKYGGVGNKHKMAWLNWDAKFQLLKETTKDMDFIESRKYLRDVTNQHWCIPPELFGILENSNRSTIDAAYYLYTKNVLRKELKFIDDVLNRQLVPDFSTSVYLEHDNVVPEDDEFVLKRTTEGLKNGAVYIDEWRLANGLDILANGEGRTRLVPLNMIEVLENGEAHTLLPVESPKQTKTLTDEQKSKTWEIIDKAAVKNERRFISVMKKYFQSQQNRINIALEKAIKAPTDNPDELLDWREENNKLLGSLKPLWRESVKEGLEVANSVFGLGISFDLINPAFLIWVEDCGAEDVKGINDTTKEKLRKTLSEGIGIGEPIPKLRDRVSSVMEDAKTSRATLIARTETHNTTLMGTYETYKAAGVEKKEWFTTMDGRERDSHGNISPKIIGIKETFSNGLAYPGDPNGGAEEVCNCRCALLPVLPD